MKRNLLFCLALTSAVSLSAQVLESDNYNSYTIGNVATSTTGTVPGQGGMAVYTGAVTDYQIVNGDAAHGKYLQVIGGVDGTAASSRYVFKSGLATAWAARTAGNNIIKGKVDIYTGTSTNQHASGVAIYGTDDGIVGVRYNSQTKLMTGLAYLDTGLSSAFYTITGISATTYPANTWVTVGYSYNKTTGEITYTIGNAAPLTLTVNGATTVAGLDPAEFDVYSSPYRASATAPANTGPTTFGIDNYSVHAGNNITLGTVENDARKSSIIAIGPNPTVDYLNILTEMKISNLEIYDMSGKKMPVQLEGNKVNVRNLSSGSYIVSFETKDGKTTEKFIKK